MRRRARELLERVGLGERVEHRPDELSGGEQQRVAIARALMNEPEFLLCDEPTGNLDERTAERVMALIVDLHRGNGQTVVMVTHDLHLAAYADRVAHLSEGHIDQVVAVGEQGEAGLRRRLGLPEGKGSRDTHVQKVRQGGGQEG